MATAKQKGVFNKMVENGGNMSKAMREAGYSESMAKNPQKLTRSKGFQELMDKYGLDDTSLVKKHRELLESKKITRVTEKNGVKTEVEELNPLAARALDMAYKVKSLYAPQKVEADIRGGMGQLLLEIEEQAKREREEQLS